MKIASTLQNLVTKTVHVEFIFAQRSGASRSALLSGWSDFGSLDIFANYSVWREGDGLRSNNLILDARRGRWLWVRRHPATQYPQSSFPYYVEAPNCTTIAETSHRKWQNP